MIDWYEDKLKEGVKTSDPIDTWDVEVAENNGLWIVSDSGLLEKHGLHKFLSMTILSANEIIISHD